MGTLAPGVQQGARGRPSPIVVLSLERSRTRRVVLEHLASRGPSYISQIARAVGVGLPATIGALRGLEGRYAPPLSLVELGLAEELEPDTFAGENVRVYRATYEGERAWAFYEKERG